MGLYIGKKYQFWSLCAGPFYVMINSLPNHNILELSRLKGFADDKINVIQKTEICLGKGTEQLWEKEKMLVTSIFSFSHNVLKRFLF